MRTYDFIFSDRRQRRILRHLLFWILCWIYYQYTYLIPTTYFPDWKIQGTLPAFEQLGSSKFILFVFVNSFRSMLFQMFFTYVLIYLLLPKYLLKGKYILFATGVAILMGIALILWVFLAAYTHSPICKAFGVVAKSPTISYYFNCGADGMLFFYPTIAGIALAIKLLKRWYLKQKEAQQLITSKTNAELQLLKAQVHPHFLFNTLNNIYSFILTSSPRAPELVKKLSGLLYYIIHAGNQPLVSLEKELKMIKDYIALETVRYGEQFDIIVDIRGDYNDKEIAPLLLLPFVENSFKHGSSKTLSKPWVNLNIIIEKTTMYFMLNNSRPQEYISPNCNGGIGLSNVQKRLQLLYPERHELKMTSEPEHFTVLLEIDLEPINKKLALKKTEKEILQYELV